MSRILVSSLAAAAALAGVIYWEVQGSETPVSNAL